MQTQTATLPAPSELPAGNWGDEAIEDFLWGAGVYTLVGTHGFRKTAGDAFMDAGFRLATIRQDKEPFERLFKLSLYVLGNRQRLGRREMKALVLGVMAKIGCTLKPGDCHVDVAGRKVVASVVLPRWAWPREV